MKPAIFWGLGVILTSFAKEEVRKLPMAWNSVIPAVITRDVVSLSDKVFAASKIWSDTGSEELEWGPCDWMPRSVGSSTSTLSGPSGTLATSELDGNGRTTLIADGLEWSVIRLPAGTVVLPATSAGISVVAADHYIVQFSRPTPDGQYAIRWDVPGFPSPFLEIFEVGVTAIDPNSLPHRGDPCRISFDLNRNPFISWWEPAGG